MSIINVIMYTIGIQRLFRRTVTEQEEELLPMMIT